ncbi:MAG TPA: helix-turn-helix transcriptional regulator [Gammaproteobacteria bacterium]|nr:helix-turn-helix transcriptional regulator [Gammaproteobacteria bacterium]
MASNPEQRHELGAFLRARRERLRPEEAGIRRGSQRRRTPGLRREEVAHLCRLSPTWYTWLEQGRDVSMSPQALARIATALRLTPAERGYVFELAQKRDPEAPVDREPGAPPPILRAALEAMNVPAYLLDSRWNACGWNASAAELFAAWLGGPERNVLRYVFLDPGAPRFIADWENRARRLVAEFRADTARGGEDPELQAFVQALREESPRFTGFWNGHDVLEREGGSRTFVHPERGWLRYEQITLRPAGLPGYKLVMLMGDRPGSSP